MLIQIELIFFSRVKLIVLAQIVQKKHGQSMFFEIINQYNEKYYNVEKELLHMKRKILATLLSSALLLSLAACGDTPAETTKTDASATSKVETTEKDTESTDSDSASTPAEGGDITDAEDTNKELEISLYTYYADASKELVDAVLPKVNEKYPNVKINIEHRTDSDGAILKTRAAVGELPDIFECTGTLTDIFIQSKDILPLNDAMEAQDYSSKFIDSAFNGKMHSDGNYYALSTSTPDNANFFYNKEVFEANNLSEPKNYDELKNVVETLKSADIIPLALFAEQKWPGLQLFDLAIVSEEPLGLAGLEDGTTKITDPAYVNAANKIYELVNLGLIGKGAFNTNASQAFELHKTGAAGMVFNGAWYFGDSLDYGDNVGYFPYNPFADEGMEEAVRWNMSGGMASSGGYAVSAQGQDPEFCKGILLEFVYQRTKANTQIVAAVNMLKEDVKPNNPRPEAFEAYANSIENFKTLSKYEWSLNDPELITVLEDYSEKLYTGTYSPEQFISDLDKAISDIVG